MAFSALVLPGNTLFFEAGRIFCLFVRKKMGYTDQQRELGGFLREEGNDRIIPGTDIRVVKEMFHSKNGLTIPASPRLPGLFRDFFPTVDASEVNDNFSYNIFLPAKPEKGFIILLHGLNERTWDKYILWALRLASDTRKPVILFPIANHMNRSPRTWFDRHAMMPAVAARMLSEPGARLTTFANVALSTRLSISPHLFFLSGYQAVNDIISLTEEIKSGRHPSIGREGSPDIFAYSIGVMLAQVLMLSREKPLPPESRLFFFCGGSALNKMNGTSKLIMDSKAFDRLISYYIDEIDEKQKQGGDWLTKIVDETAVGEGYYAMSSAARLKKVFGDPFRDLDGRVRAVTVSSDRVIPPAGIKEAMLGADIDTWLPDYPCTHENPFPLFTTGYAGAVDSAFDRLFTSASAFLA